MATLRLIVVALFSLFLDVSSSWTLVPQANSLSAAPEAASDERGATQEQNATLAPPWFSLPRGSIFLSGASANASADDDASANLTDSAAVFFNASLPACLALDLYDLILNSATLQSSNSRITERMRPADSSYSDVNPAAIALGLMVVLALVLIFGGAAFPRTSLFIVSTVFTFMLLLAFFVFLNEAEFNPTKRFFECVFPLAISSVLSLVIGILVICLVASHRWLVPFIFGFTWGALAMYVLRDVIIAFAPSLVRARAFHIYWALLIIFSLVIAAASAKLMKDSALVFSTVALGGYMLAVAATGLVPLLGGPPLPPHVFFFILLTATLFGFLCQLVVRERERAPQKQKGVWE